jgi:hypothetical protein
MSIDGQIEIERRPWRPWIAAEREQIRIEQAAAGHDRGASG